MNVKIQAHVRVVLAHQLLKIVRVPAWALVDGMPLLVHASQKFNLYANAVILPVILARLPPPHLPPPRRLLFAVTEFAMVQKTAVFVRQTVVTVAIRHTAATEVVTEEKRVERVPEIAAFVPRGATFRPGQSLSPGQIRPVLRSMRARTI